MTQPDNPYKPTGRHAYEAARRHTNTHLVPWNELPPDKQAYWNAVTAGIQAVERARVQRRIRVLAHAVVYVPPRDIQAMTAMYAQIYELIILAGFLGVEVPDDLPVKLPPLTADSGLADTVTYPELPKSKQVQP